MYNQDTVQPLVPLNLLLLDFHSWGILLTIAIMQEKQQNNLFEKNYYL